MENNIAPELRFPEFEGEWEEKKLGDIAEISSGGTPKRTQMSYWNGIIPWVSTGLINYNLILETDEYITYDGLINSSAKLFPKGTILMAMYGQGKTRGKVSILGIEASTNQACAALQLKNSLSINFVYSHLAKDYNRIRNIANDGGQQNLSLGLIKSLKIFIPSLSEQTKIATFLTTVDQRINLLEKKKTHLEQYKKGVMQKLFPPKGEQTPEIRFKKEDGTDYPAWEEKKLGEVFNSVKGQGLSKGKIEENGEHECILYGELYTTYTEVIAKIISRTNSNEGVQSKVGDLLVPCSTTTTGIDLANVTALNKANVLLGGDITILRAKQNIDSIFFAYYLSNYKKNELARFGQGTTIVHLYYSHFKVMKIDVPKVEEQEKIASFLVSIDNSIKTLSDQIEESKVFKKGLLQKMFV